MRQNLDTLKNEVVDYIRSQGIILFHGCSRILGSQASVSWDTHRYPDFRAFLDCARALGVKLVVLHHQEFSAAAVDDALDQLGEADIEPDEQRSLERRLEEMRVYQGLVSAVELSFDYDRRIYLFNVLTDWYMEFMDTVDEIESYIPEEEGEDEEEGPVGGYFSRN